MLHSFYTAAETDQGAVGDVRLGTVIFNTVTQMCHYD